MDIGAILDIGLVEIRSVYYTDQYKKIDKNRKKIYIGAKEVLDISLGEIRSIGLARIGSIYYTD
jgi:hypothetical protein